jgi:flagellar biosynthesis protein FliP
MLYFSKNNNIKPKLDRNKNKNKVFVPTTILITVLLSVCSLVHAICSFFNVVVVFVFILHYVKGTHSHCKKILYTIAILLCSTLSICIAIMIIIALISTCGSSKFVDVLKTL